MRQLLLAMVLVIVLGGCTDEPPTTEPTSSPTPPRLEVAIDWANRPADPVLLSSGFSVRGCEGDAPFLCILRETADVGVVEYFSFPAPAQAPAEAVEGLVRDDYQSFTTDRSATCPDGYEVKTEAPQGAEVGGSDGLRSEYSVVDGAGRTVERYVKFWSVADGRVHLLSAEAQEEGSCSPGEGVQFRNDVLTEFLPSFEAIAEGSKFPSATG